MGRGSTQLLIRKIIKSIAEGPKTISEIAETSKLDRTAVGRYLNILKESNLLIEEQAGTSKKFTLVPSYRTDTYFGLPLTEKAEKQVNSLYSLIKQNWGKMTSKNLLSTHVQKIAHKVIETCDELEIPHGWYMYGAISVATFDESREYRYSGLSEEVENCVKETTAGYAKNKFAWQSKKQQYEEAGKQLYLKKEEILSILFGDVFAKDPKRALHVLVKKIRKLIDLAPKPAEKKYDEILDAYQDLMFDITTKLDNHSISEHKIDITVLFQSIWKYVALHHFKQDLSEYYSEQVLDVHFKLEIKQQEDQIIELGTQLNSLIPEEELSDELRKFRDAIMQKKPTDQKKLKKQNEELEKILKEQGVKALNKELLGRFN